MVFTQRHARTVRRRTNQEWLAALGSDGPARTRALNDLQSHLTRAVLVYLGRHRGTVQNLGRAELMRLVEDCTAEVLQLIDARLPTFRDDSRFTTWVNAIAVKHAAGEVRSRFHLMPGE